MISFYCVHDVNMKATKMKILSVLTVTFLLGGCLAAAPKKYNYIDMKPLQDGTSSSLYVVADRPFNKQFTVKIGETAVKTRIMNRKKMTTAVFNTDVPVIENADSSVYMTIKKNVAYEVIGEALKGDGVYKVICLQECGIYAQQPFYALADQSGKVDSKLYWRSKQYSGSIVEPIVSQFDLSVPAVVQFGTSTSDEQIDAHTYVYESTSKRGNPVLRIGQRTVEFSKQIMQMNLFASNASLRFHKIDSSDVATFEVIGREVK